MTDAPPASQMLPGADRPPAAQMLPGADASCAAAIPMSADAPDAARPSACAGETVAWSVQVLRADAAFDELAEEWEDLYRRSPEATPFQSYGWLASWWREYGRPGRLRLCLVRRGDQLVAAAPLMLRRRGPFRVLAPLGGDQSDFHDLLVDGTWAADACVELTAALLAEPGWHLIDLPDVHPMAAVQQVRAAWTAPTWRAPSSIRMEIPAGSMAELLARLPRNTAKKIRTKLRRIERVGMQLHEVASPEVEDAVGALVGLHREQWRGRGVNPEHLRPRFHRHLAGAVSRMVERGQASMFQYRVAGELVASDLTVVGHGFVGTYLAAYRPELRQQVDVTVMMLSQVLRLTERRGMPMLHMLRGAEPYKLRWHPIVTRNQRLLLAGRGHRQVVAFGYALSVRARAWLADALRDRAPWLRRARLSVRNAAGRLRRRGR